MNIPALMYHDVVTPGQPDASGFPGAAAAHYKLDEAEFAAHLAALATSGLRFAAVGDGTAPDDGRCLLTFDDGGASAIAVAAALSQRGMVGHFLITGARIDQPGFVSAAQIRALHAAGHVVGSHSHTHPPEISRLDHAALAAEWEQSVARLKALLGVPVTVASVPGGFYSRQVAQAAAAAGIRYLFTSEPTTRTHKVGGCLVLGRYTLWRGESPQQAMALATGAGGARWQQWLGWNVKKLLKRFAGPLYRQVRRFWLNAVAARRER